MRVLVWEYVTAVGAGKPDLPPALRAEGAMMLRALCRDLAMIPGVELVVSACPAQATSPHPSCPRKRTSETAVLDPCLRGGDATRQPRAEFHQHGTRSNASTNEGGLPLTPGLLAGCDAFWPIAPETDGCLEEVTQLAHAAGPVVLNSRHDALAVARSKRATAHHLNRYGIPVVPTLTARDPPPPGPDGWVIKPDDGAGASGARLVSCRDRLDRCREAEPDAVVQPYLPGDALSLSLLVQEGAAWLLSCNRQRIDLCGDRFVFRGNIVAGAEDRRAALAPLAEAIAAALPGLWGYVGVDVIDGAGGPIVLEINPRLTTSYVGLAEAIGINPASQVLALLEQPLGRLMRRLRPRPIAVEVPRV